MSNNIEVEIYINKEDKGFLGKGRVMLLELIDKYGSILKAAKEMNMSYKAAWDIIDSLNNISEKPLVIAKAGGRKGGQTYLTEEGKKLVERYKMATEEEIKKAEEIEKICIDKMKRKMDINGFSEILYKNIESSIWEEIGKRCLACTSCTQLCPTCFCFDIIERNDIEKGISERVRIYDSCFNPSFATVHKFNIRESIASRYRQWYMHKFAYWKDQFNQIGCVGCGRCITWCPAYIDVTEEEKIIRNLK